MSIHPEDDVRAALGRALDEFAPSSLPLGAVLHQGRRVKVRRRATTAGALTVILVLGAGAASVTHHLAFGTPRPATPSYHVTVNPPGPAAPRDLIATGTVNGKPWRIGGQFTRHPLETSFTMSGGQGPATFMGAPAKPGDAGAPAAGAGSSGSSSPDGWDTEVMPVRHDVTSLLVSLTNGQSLVLHPVPVFGPAYARFVAFAVPSAADVTKVAAYSGLRELAYAIPFTGNGMAMFERWLSPGQPALPRPASRLIAAGTWAGKPWSAHVYLGPWGTCFTQDVHGDPSADCSAHLPDRGRVAENPYSVGPSTPSVATIVTTPAVARLVITYAHSGPSDARLVWLDGTGYAAVASGPADPATHYTAYSASGHRLASGSLNP